MGMLRISIPPGGIPIAETASAALSVSDNVKFPKAFPVTGSSKLTPTAFPVSAAD
jgi:hypothetical protein